MTDLMLKILKAKFKYYEPLDKWWANVTPVEFLFMIQENLSFDHPPSKWEIQWTSEDIKIGKMNSLKIAYLLNTEKNRNWLHKEIIKNTHGR